MTRINLLPHREMRRERRRKDFVGQAVLAGLVGALIAVVVALVIDARIQTQDARNRFIEAENRKLDAQIKEIAQLRQEIDDLKSRKLAVEDLQRERTLPVHVLDDLVRHAPAGIYYRKIRQLDHRVSLVGVAQSNERISDLLHVLATGMPWLTHPELVEIKAGKPAPAGKPGAAAAPVGEQHVFYEFSVNASVKELPGQAGASGAVSGRTPAVPARGAAPAPRAGVAR